MRDASNFLHVPLILKKAINLEGREGTKSTVFCWNEPRDITCTYMQSPLYDARIRFMPLYLL